jgi:hypothetical protein
MYYALHQLPVPFHRVRLALKGLREGPKDTCIAPKPEVSDPSCPEGTHATRIVRLLRPSHWIPSEDRGQCRALPSCVYIYPVLLTSSPLQWLRAALRSCKELAAQVICCLAHGCEYFFSRRFIWRHPAGLAPHYSVPRAYLRLTSKCTERQVGWSARLDRTMNVSPCVGRAA